ncbi:MAG TPA: YncE family protein, partial [Dongiaceae bacterium]|nr:YncE family protein [Dongiaceae bacterium]
MAASESKLEASISRVCRGREQGLSNAIFVKVLRAVAVLMLTLLAIAAKPAPHQSGAMVKERYLSPLEIAVSPDGRLLYVVCGDSDEVRIVEADSGKVLGNVAVGHVPRGIVLSPDARRAYVTNAWSDTVSVIDLAARQVIQTLHTGFEPTGVVVDRSGTTLYVANRLSSDVSVIDLGSGQEIKRLLAGRGASYLALSADGRSIYCTHIYPNAGPHRTQPNSEITVIDTATRRVVDRKPLHNV